MEAIAVPARVLARPRAKIACPRERPLVNPLGEGLADGRGHARPRRGLGCSSAKIARPRTKIVRPLVGPSLRTHEDRAASLGAFAPHVRRTRVLVRCARSPT